MSARAKGKTDTAGPRRSSAAHLQDPSPSGRRANNTPFKAVLDQHVQQTDEHDVDTALQADAATGNKQQRGKTPQHAAAAKRPRSAAATVAPRSARKGQQQQQEADERHA